MKIVSYARFSPRPQAQDCDSCIKQLEDIRTWAKVHGHEIVSEHHDDAMSGADDDRPGLQDAIQACRRGYYLVCRSIDRLSRDSRATECFLLSVASKGAYFQTIDGVCTFKETPIMRFVRRIRQAGAELQRDEIRERTSYRMRQHQASGRRMSAVCPYGTMRGPDNVITLPSGETKTIKTLVPCPDEQPVVSEILLMRDEGVCPSKIARRLNDGNKTCRGSRWSRQTVTKILRRQAKTS